MAIKEIHEQMQEEALQRNGGLNRDSSNSRYHGNYSPRIYRFDESGTRPTSRYVCPIERRGNQLDIAQASTNDHRMSHGAAITNHVEGDHPVAPERDCAACDYEPFHSMRKTRSLDHVLWILDNALSLISETIEEESECTY
jgi:hypothetical protein